MLNLDDHSHKEFHYGYTEEDADQAMLDCFMCGKPFFPQDTGLAEFCSNACRGDYIDTVGECDECREPAGEPLYSMGYRFCSTECRSALEHQMAVVYERMDEIDGMLISDLD